MGTIEFHGCGARIEDVEKADRLDFDLDPDEGLEFAGVVSAAFHVQDVLAQMGLVTFPMVAGGKGVHVIAPLITSAEWPQVKNFAHRFALALRRPRPIASLPRGLMPSGRGGYSSITCATSAARPRFCPTACGHAPIAAPITWEELRDLDSPARWHIGDGAGMVQRAALKDLAHWGRADQILPDL